MPRSVNSVAKRARRKKVLKQAKGYFGRRKNVWTVAKNAVDKAMLYAYRDRRNKKEHSEHYGSCVSTLDQERMDYLIHNSWENSKLTILT